jgi:hypothetical protein
MFSNFLKIFMEALIRVQAAVTAKEYTSLRRIKQAYLII